MDAPLQPSTGSPSLWDKLSSLFPYFLTLVGVVITAFLTFKVQSANNDTSAQKSKADILNAIQNTANAKRKDEIELLKILVPQVMDKDVSTRGKARALLLSIYRNEGSEGNKILAIIDPDSIAKKNAEMAAVSVVPQEWGIIVGSDKDLESAQTETAKIMEKGFKKVAIFKKGVWYNSVILGYSKQSDAINANYIATSVIRDGTTVVCINDWAKDRADKGSYFDVPVYKTSN